VNVLYFTGAYRADSMVSHTHGDLVAALRDRGVAMEIVTIGSPSQPQAMRTARSPRHAGDLSPPSLQSPRSLPARVERPVVAVRPLTQLVVAEGSLDPFALPRAQSVASASGLTITASAG
jgi:hypothetical protein